MEITKEGAQSLRIKMRNAELHLKEVTVIYLRLLTACIKIARTSVKDEKANLLSLVQLRAQEQALN